MNGKERKGHFFHVTFDKNDHQWHVKEVKAKEFTTFDNKEDAIDKAEAMAKKAEMGHVVIHNERGKFEVFESF